MNFTNPVEGGCPKVVSKSPGAEIAGKLVENRKARARRRKVLSPEFIGVRKVGGSAGVAVLVEEGGKLERIFENSMVMSS